MRHPEDLERTFQRGRERSEQKSRRGKKGEQVAERARLKHTEDKKRSFSCFRRCQPMSQYAMTESSSQEDQALSEQVAQQLQRFVQPFLELLDAYVDCRLVETLWQTMVAIIVARTSLLLSVLGEYIADPQHGPAGSKQLSRLLH